MIYVDEAIDFLRSNLSEQIIFVGFSGGKDSVCIARLMKLSGIQHKLYYSCTGIDPPELVYFIKKEYPECIFLHPLRSFFKNLLTNVPPSSRLRWCCHALKKAPGQKIPIKQRVMGIRAEESTKRKEYPRINIFKKTGETLFYPILDWKEWQVWEFIESENIPISELYTDFNRLGCVICPYHSEKSGKLHEKYRHRWPKFFEIFENTIAELYKKRVNQGKVMAYSSPGEFCEAWYKNCNAYWYKVEQPNKETK